MVEVTIKTDYIKMSQLLKLAQIIQSGAEAKMYLAEGKVKLNGDAVVERGKKVYPGDVVLVLGERPVKVVKDSVCT